MEAFEAVKTVFHRILETESVTDTRKIIGYIYLLDHADHEMIRLAFGPDKLIQSLIQKAKIELNLIPKPVPSPPISPSLQFNTILHSHQPFATPPALQPHWDTSPHYQNHDQFVGLADQFDPFGREVTNFSRDCYSPDGNFSVRGRRDGIPTKICHYFNKGHCRHGSNCKFLHLRPVSDYNEPIVDDQATLSTATLEELEKLESEITEILKLKRGNPISIASLPMIYYERYGRTLQADGYLTESQRHGKTGYSLTKLLARLRNSIRLIDRPHGQHSVVLADDAPRFMENRHEHHNQNPGPIVSGSKQIYLTFPAESIFSEDDVANYFSTFGAVQDVRIPCQQKRMFGFVTFHSAEAVHTILMKGNPHYVSGARVLVKPYREKPKLFERRYFEKFEAPMCCHSHHIEMDHDLQARFNASRFFARQLADESEVAIQIEMMRLSQLQLARGPSYHENNFDDQKPSEDEADDNSKFQSSNLIMNLDHADDDCINQDNSESGHGLTG